MFRVSHSKKKCNAKTIPMTCKFCGEEVFYFSCDHGAKVFFEELGPPWTRHIHEERMKGIEAEMQADLKKVEAQFETAKSVLEEVLTEHRFDIGLLTSTSEFLTETIRDLKGMLEFAENQKSEFESDLIETTEFLEDSNEKVFTKDSHQEREIGKPLSGPQCITVNGEQYHLTARQVENLKSVYKADRTRNPKAGPGGTVKKVLVEPGILPKSDTNHAWNAVARIVGHLTPAQKRASKPVNKPLKNVKKEGSAGDFQRKPEPQGKLFSGLECITVRGKQYYLSSQQVENLKAAYKADRTRNPKAGPTGAIQRVLVSKGIIPETDVNHAWNAVARIVGHLTPTQKRRRR